MKSKIFCFFLALAMIFGACNKEIPDQIVDENMVKIKAFINAVDEGKLNLSDSCAIKDDAVAVFTENLKEEEYLLNLEQITKLYYLSATSSEGNRRYITSQTKSSPSP